MSADGRVRVVNRLEKAGNSAASNNGKSNGECTNCARFDFVFGSPLEPVLLLLLLLLLLPWRTNSCAAK
jgi:hypothetical protein